MAVVPDPGGGEPDSSLPRKAEMPDRLIALRSGLVAYVTAGDGLAVVIPADHCAAMLAHRAAAPAAGKNLLVPKPKPEAAKARPGQRQLQPMPKSRPRWLIAGTTCKAKHSVPGKGRHLVTCPGLCARRIWQTAGSDGGLTWQWRNRTTLARRDAGDNPSATRRSLRLGGAGTGDRHPLLQPRAEYCLQPEVPAAHRGRASKSVALCLWCAHRADSVFNFIGR